VNYKNIIDIIVSIDKALNLDESFYAFFDKIEKLEIFEYIRLSLNILEENEKIYSFGKKSDEIISIKKDYFSLQYTQKDKIDRTIISLILNFIENRILLNIEKSKVGIIQKCDSLFDSSANSAYGSENQVINYLKRTYDLSKSEYYNQTNVPFNRLKQIEKLCASDDRYLIGKIENINIMIIKLEVIEDVVAGFLYFEKNTEFSSTLIDLFILASEVFDTNVLHTKTASMYASRFKKYVGNKEILDILIKNPNLLDVKKDDVVIMSVDLVDSTKFASNNNNPIEVFENINYYLELIAKIVTNKYAGTLDKYIGDEVMAIFGAPIKKKSFVDDSINCAIDILAEIKKVNKLREDVGKVVFDVKVSVGYAENVVIGEVGSEDTQIDYTAIGDDVNKLFRMASYGKRASIIVNEKMVKKADKYNFIKIDELSFKGIENRERIYEFVEQKNKI